ncbi:MAG: NDP-mannose synthase [Candidatus Sumerlaeota bacterium]|nr:NDP-mannose synthase [Candidatus Sumerlaeota bacterium]
MNDSPASPATPPRAVILCGGKGTRLRPYTTVLPKPLVPIGDRPILEVVLEALRSAGFTNVTLCVGHLAELIRAFFGDGSKFGLKIDYAIEDKPLGTIGPLAFVENLGEEFLVMNGDVLTDLDLRTFFLKHLRGGADLTVATYLRRVKMDFGVLSAYPHSDSVQGFSEKPTHEYEVSMGVYAMNRRVLGHFAPGEAFGFDDLVLTLLGKNRPVRRVLHTGHWLDIGRVEDYEAAQNDPRWGTP